MPLIPLFVRPCWQFQRAAGLHEASSSGQRSVDSAPFPAAAAAAAAAAVHPPSLSAVTPYRSQESKSQDQVSEPVGGSNAFLPLQPAAAAAAAAPPPPPPSLSVTGADASVQTHSVQAPDSGYPVAPVHASAYSRASASAGVNTSASANASASASAAGGGSAAGVFVLPVGRCRERLSQLVHGLRADTQRVTAGCRWVGGRHCVWCALTPTRTSSTRT